jgi:hypothetical protein
VERKPAYFERREGTSETGKPSLRPPQLDDAAPAIHYHLSPDSRLHSSLFRATDKVAFV